MKYEQSFCKAVGEYGCYALCIINIAEEHKGLHYNILKTIEEGIRQGLIEWHEDNYEHKDNLYVKDAAAFLGMITGEKWSLRHEYDNVLYKPKEGEYIVEKWERNGYGHFARTKAGYNSLQDSKCVKLGKLASLRIFKREG